MWNKLLAKSPRSKCSPSKKNTQSDDWGTKCKKHFISGLEREKLQDIKLIKQRLNHNTRLDTKNEYEKGEGLITCLGTQKHTSKISNLSQKLNFLCFGFSEPFYKANRAFLYSLIMHASITFSSNIPQARSFFTYESDIPLKVILN